MAPANRAAYLIQKGKPLEIREAEYPSSLGPNELAIRNHAVAINPVDWIVQFSGTSFFPWLKLPLVLGYDVAGEVVAVGENVKRFKVGDRVVSPAMGHGKERKDSQNRESGFQEYVVLMEDMTTELPADMKYEEGVVLPLALMTASSGLFVKENLGLDLPPVEKSGIATTEKPHTNSKGTVLIWGGSTSVGSVAIQLAIAAGYTVVTTCSPRNNDLVKSLGASQAFDYNSPSVISDIVAHLTAEKGKLVGALAIGSTAPDACIDIVSSVPNARKMVALATHPAGDRIRGPMTAMDSLSMVVYFLSWTVKSWLKCKIRGIKTNFYVAEDCQEKGNHVGPTLFAKFLPGALARGEFKAVPQPEVVGNGLEAINAAMDTQRKGVSAKKIVVTL
jgi:NADPH:quinone reductase-like Zn-dependent oxidoreductase